VAAANVVDIFGYAALAALIAIAIVAVGDIPFSP
jgi:Flp pilus assembly pilin Flp